MLWRFPIGGTPKSSKSLDHFCQPPAFSCLAKRRAQGTKSWGLHSHGGSTIKFYVMENHGKSIYKCAKIDGLFHGSSVYPWMITEYITDPHDLGTPKNDRTKTWSQKKNGEQAQRIGNASSKHVWQMCVCVCVFFFFLKWKTFQYVQHLEALVQVGP